MTTRKLSDHVKFTVSLWQLLQVNSLFTLQIHSFYWNAYYDGKDDSQGNSSRCWTLDKNNNNDNDEDEDEDEEDGCAGDECRRISSTVIQPLVSWQSL